jgi:hypothetical protein
MTLALHPHLAWAEANLVSAYARSGDRTAAELLYRAMQGRAATEYVQHTSLAMAAVSCGRQDDALAALDRAVEEHDCQLPHRLTHWPDLEPFRRLPAYRHIRRRLGWQ